MSKKQKIIVSITGIFLVLMILVGLTYAYFLTKITGNTNTKSISITTANLVLEYGENTNVVQGINNAEPGYSVEKIFTATNKGNSTVTYGAALENIVNGLTRQTDLVYTLTCTSYLKSGFSLSSDGTITGTVDGTCDGVSTETKFPSTSNLSIMVNNTIDTTHTHAYKLTITYKEMNIDQSTDMNKTFSAKVNIVDLNALIKTNPYEDSKTSLAYNIINNAINKTNGTELVLNPKTMPAQATSLEDEKELSMASDDYGTSYYYRGSVEDNYVNFAGMCWKIVRIEGDGSTKLILEDISAECNSSSYTGNWSDGTTVQYGNDINSGGFLNSYSDLGNSLKSFQISKLSSYLDKLKIDDWCYDTNIIYSDEYGNYYYGASTRISRDKSPLLTCTGTKLNKYNDNTNMYVGTLTAEEISFAGVTDSANTTHYLYNNNNKLDWWTLSPDGYVSDWNRDVVLLLSYTGGFNNDFVSESHYFRPAVTVLSNIQITSGDGTKGNPYKIAS